jgi:hypothetical protein
MEIVWILPTRFRCQFGEFANPFPAQLDRFVRMVPVKLSTQQDR